MNTRVKDLADLMLLMHMTFPESRQLRPVIENIFTSRAAHPMPARLPNVPAIWTASFAIMALDLGLTTTTPQEAVEQLNRFWERIFPDSHWPDTR